MKKEGKIKRSAQAIKEKLGHDHQPYNAHKSPQRHQKREGGEERKRGRGMKREEERKRKREREKDSKRKRAGRRDTTIPNTERQFRLIVLSLENFVLSFYHKAMLGLKYTMRKFGNNS